MASRNAKRFCSAHESEDLPTTHTLVWTTAIQLSQERQSHCKTACRGVVPGSGCMPLLNSAVKRWESDARCARTYSVELGLFMRAVLSAFR
jgi:hypothetical protein